MEAKTKERFFSVELKSRADLRSVTMANGTRENVLVEGTIGELVQIGFTEGIVLEVVGDKGVLRIDLSEDEITRMSQNVHSEENSNASSKKGRSRKRGRNHEGGERDG